MTSITQVCPFSYYINFILPIHVSMAILRTLPLVLPLHLQILLTFLFWPMKTLLLLVLPILMIPSPSITTLLPIMERWMMLLIIGLTHQAIYSYTQISCYYSNYWGTLTTQSLFQPSNQWCMSHFLLITENITRPSID